MKKIKIFPLLLLLCLLFTAAAPGAYALDAPELNAKAAILVDLNTGRMLYAKNMDDRRAPASLTKVMTILLALEAVDSGEHSLDETVTAGMDCQQGLQEDSSSVWIVAGEEMSLRDLIYSAAVASANDACNVIASYLAGSISAFVEQMNTRAAQLGCTNTRFFDPNGLSNDNVTSAYDLYLITREAMTHPLFMDFCNTADYNVGPTNVNGAREYHNSNALISDQSIYGSNYLYKYAAGVKTGYTRAAGYCLISTAEKDGMLLLGIVMGCDGYYNANIDEYKNFSDSIALYDWAFDSFAYQTVLSTADPVGRAPVELAQGQDEIILHPQEDVVLLLPKEITEEDVSTRVTLYEDRLVAPLDAGLVLGEATVSIKGEDYAIVRLVNTSPVELAQGEYLKMQIKAFFSNPWVIAAILIIAVLAIGYIVLVSRYRRLRRRHLKARREAEERRRKLRQETEAALRDEDGSWKDLY